MSVAERVRRALPPARPARRRARRRLLRRPGSPGADRRGGALRAGVARRGRSSAQGRARRAGGAAAPLAPRPARRHRDGRAQARRRGVRVRRRGRALLRRPASPHCRKRARSGPRCARRGPAGDGVARRAVPAVARVPGRARREARSSPGRHRRGAPRDAPPIWSVFPKASRTSSSSSSDEPWAAYNYYEGDLRSRIAVNTDVPMATNFVLELMAHELYPGHQTEHAGRSSSFTGMAVGPRRRS